MRSPSIERLHHQLQRRIKLVESYTEIKGMEFIIRACRLKPYEHLFEEKEKKILLHRWWIDEFNNSLILKKKKVQLIYNDLRLDRQKIVSTDLYYGLSLSNVAKMSRLIHLVAGQDEDLLQECYLLTFLGIDEHLRSYLYWYGEWQQVSPLLMGMKSLELLAQDTEVKHYHQIGKKENSAIPCVNGRTWLSLLPPSEAFLNLLKGEYEIIYNVFQQKDK